LLIRKNRWKGRWGSICRDCGKAMALFAVICVMTAALIYSYSYIISSPYFRIKNTVIKGCRELTEKDVLKLAAINPSQTIFAINIKAMARRISSSPWVRNVAISRQLPDRLVVEVEERIPLALFKISEDFFLLDKDGMFFKKLTADDDVDVPVLTGYCREGRVNAELLNKTLVLLKYLAASQIFPKISMVSEVNGSEVAGISLFTDNGLCLKLGFDNYEAKLQRLVPVVTALNRNNVQQPFLNIDLRNTSKIYVEPRGNQEPVARKVKKEGLRT
jgi:cell division protein FtsQ